MKYTDVKKFNGYIVKPKNQVKVILLRILNNYDMRNTYQCTMNTYRYSILLLANAFFAMCEIWFS